MSAGIPGWTAAAEPWGGGLRAAVGALSDEVLLEKLARYKRQVAKRYRVVEPDVIEQLLPSEELLLSPKLDGELWFLVKKDGDVALCAYNGRVLHGVAPLAGVKEHVAKLPDFIVAGELVASVSGAERPRSFHTGATLSDAKGEHALSFHAFDLVEEGGQDRLGTPYEQRHAWLESSLGTLPKDSKVRVVLTERGDPKLVAARYREWVLGNKFEGVVVRSQRGLTYKIKPTTTVDVVVVAFGERVTGDVRQVRELQVGLFRDDGTIQLVGSIGTGLSEDDRARWHQRLSAIEVKSAFRLANREGTLCRFVRPEIVIEMRVSDLLVTDAWDAPIRRMSLRYAAGEADARYEAVSELRTAVPLHPVILRERTDKKANSTDAGMTQITSYLEEVGVDPVKAGARAAAEVAMRGVFTKETKGQVAVRKYLVVRTNKEAEGTHPPFAVFFSDFAAGRKEPLQSSLRTAATLDEARVQVERWLAENIKKGWGEIASGRVGAGVSAGDTQPATAVDVDTASPAKAEAPAKKPKKAASDEEAPEAPADGDAPKKKKGAKKS
ncbi:MAG: hypothetical protein U0353_10150 [Sandaracinus sp.]